MKKLNQIRILFLLCISCMQIWGMKPDYLRCEYLVTPLGIDAKAPRLSWVMQDKRMGAKQTAWRVVVGTDSAQVANEVGEAWDSYKTISDNMLVAYDGDSLLPFTRYYWSVRIWDSDGKESEAVTSWFETGTHNIWWGNWISDNKSIHVKPAPYFRKVFQAQKKIKTARASIAVGGLYEMYINGQRIGDHQLDPMYTRFDRRNLYVTYDITSQLQEGANAVGVLLGNGWYNHQSIAIWFFDRAPWRNRPAFCMDVRIVYEDGTVETVTSGIDWKTTLSPVIFNSIYTAEHYDARLEQEGWNTIGFDDSGWEQAINRSAPSPQIVSQQLHPIRHVEEIPAASIRKLNETLYIFDIGRNISGVSRITLTAPEGTVIRMKHGERLYPDGRVDMSNIDMHYRPVDDQDPFQTDIYVANGKGEETFMARFNYKGFQYVEVSADKPIDLKKENLTAFFMHSDVPPVGTFSTSDDVVNRIWEATNNSYLSNLFGYPTDCPQREKNGWTGDAHIAIETGLYNFDGITVYEKWLADHRDEQQPNGTLPAIIPTSGDGYAWANGPDWTSTIAIIPWNIYIFYGDAQLLEKCYDNIKRYVDLITMQSPEGLTSWGLGDWVPVKSATPVELTSSIYYYADTDILAKAARMFGRHEDHQYYTALAEKIKDAINDKYLNRSTGIYAEGTQTALSAPLFWGIVPDDMKEKVAANLAKRVQEDGLHIDVGLLGTKTILNALSENGYPDLAYAVASQKTYPSWGWWIVNGATTLYENWAIDSERDISLNHIMFGEIGAWFYKALGGIRPDESNPGFRHILLSPQFVSGLNKADVSYDSPCGKIESKWERKKKTIRYSVTIPANTMAFLTIPSGHFLEKIKSVPDSKTITLQQTENQYILPAGTYELTIKTEKY